MSKTVWELIELLNEVARETDEKYPQVEFYSTDGDYLPLGLVYAEDGKVCVDVEVPSRV